MRRTQRLRNYWIGVIRRPGEYIQERLRDLRQHLGRQRKRRLKREPGKRPLRLAFKAAFGLPAQVSVQPNSLPAKRVALHRDRCADDAGKKRVWIVVPSGIQYFRFVESGAFAEIEAACRVTYVFPDPDGPHRIPRGMDQLRDADILFTPVDNDRYAAWSMLFEVSCRALAARCASFRIRSEVAQSSRRQQARTLLQQFYFRSISVFASKPVFQRFRRNIIRALGPQPALAQALAKDDPSAIILPSSLHDCLTNDVIVTARTRGIPTIVLQTSWDTLSSKGIVAVPPDMMGVWGEQSVTHAVDLQGMARERCVVVGSAYYESFFRRPRRSKPDARRELGLPADGLTVLFGGSFRQFDEAALLRQIENAIDEGRLPKMLIFYRPHPGRELREEANFFDFDWKYTIMDEEVAVVYRANQEGRMISQNEFGYSLDRLADIYTAVDLTISPMSSIVLESLLFGLPVMGIGYSDGRNRWGPEKTSQMTHFSKLSEAPCVRICRSPGDTLEDLATVVGWAARAETATQTRDAARYFVDNGDVSYARSVLDMLVSIVPEVDTRAAKSAATQPKPAAAAGQASAVG